MSAPRRLMPDTYAEVFRRLSKPLEPIPTDKPPQLAQLRRIRAVLFDVYGTLLVSNSGEVGTTVSATCEAALADALAACDAGMTGDLRCGAALYRRAIQRSHADSRRRGIAYPEVDIVEVWREVAAELVGQGLVKKERWEENELRQLAVEYEGRANPVWPMPGLEECFTALRAKQLVLGMISNAQFYTRELFPALLGCGIESLGFDPQLQYFSYQYGRAKPGPEMFDSASRELADRGIEPGQAVYVGNDLLNDILPASRVGFRTALFAGDRRSYRRRSGDARVEGVTPDLVLTSLVELGGCLVD